jgi:hypothetical protein
MDRMTSLLVFLRVILSPSSNSSISFTVSTSRALLPLRFPTPASLLGRRPGTSDAMTIPQ